MGIVTLNDSVGPQAPPGGGARGPAVFGDVEGPAAVTH